MRISAVVREAMLRQQSRIPPDADLGTVAVVTKRSGVVKFEGDQRSESTEGLVKVVFDVPEEDGAVLKTESLWAEPLGEDHYRLRNIPFLASVRL
jgi:hypothetical protein